MTAEQLNPFKAIGLPRPQGSKNVMSRGGKTWLVESAKGLPQWRKTVATAAKAVNPKHEADKNPYYIELVFIMPRTKAMKNNPAPPMTQRPDIDKLERAILDSLTGVIWEDDSQVIKVYKHKRRARPDEEIGAEILITRYP